MNKKILKQLKSNYEEREIKPSANLWDQIDATLEKESASPQKSSFSADWWKYVAVVLLIISLGTFMYYKDGFNTEKKHYIVKQNLKEEEVLEKENYSEIIPKEEKTELETAQEIVKETDKILEKNDDKDLVTQKEAIQPQFSEHTEPRIVINQAENKINQPEIIENNINSTKVSNTKKISYVSADDLLLGRELDKTREENQKNHKQFGVLDASKIKIRRPNSLQIFGFKVFSDSTATE